VGCRCLLQHLGEAENMEVYFGQRSFDPGMQRQGTIQWIVHAGLVRAAALPPAAGSPPLAYCRLTSS
jgi:hypothetical protein